jgi:membrane protease YdiL (CAAX protease family)
MKSSKRAILLIGFFVFLAVVVSFGLDFWTADLGFKQSQVFRSIGLIAAAMISFYGILWKGLNKDGVIDESDMRTAITVSLVTVYLVLVGVVAFYAPIRVNTANEQQQANQLSQITTTMLTSFTTIVGIVVPFYFGTSAYVQVKREESQSNAGTQGGPASG